MIDVGLMEATGLAVFGGGGIGGVLLVLKTSRNSATTELPDDLPDLRIAHLSGSERRNLEFQAVLDAGAAKRRADYERWRLRCEHLKAAHQQLKAEYLLRGELDQCPPLRLPDPPHYYDS